jgi:hypothetical protein
MKKDKISLFPDERVAIHAELGGILKAGDPAEILLVILLLLALRPIPRRKASKRKVSQNGCPKDLRVLDAPRKQLNYSVRRRTCRGRALARLRP